MLLKAPAFKGESARRQPATKLSFCHASDLPQTARPISPQREGGAPIGPSKLQ
jgi:hypothetical protein